MSYSLQFDLAEAVPVASIRGLGDFRRWVESLPQDETPALRHLLEYGWTGRVAPARDELRAALESARPRSEVAETADGMLAAFREYGGSEVVSLTDGLGE